MWLEATILDSAAIKCPSLQKVLLYSTASQCCGEQDFPKSSDVHPVGCLVSYFKAQCITGSTPCMLLFIEAKMPISCLHTPPAPQEASNVEIHRCVREESFLIVTFRAR